jgi:hypothetical protein
LLKKREAIGFIYPVEAYLDLRCRCIGLAATAFSRNKNLEAAIDINATPRNHCLIIDRTISRPYGCVVRIIGHAAQRREALFMRSLLSRISIASLITAILCNASFAQKYQGDAIPDPSLARPAPVVPRPVPRPAPFAPPSAAALPPQAPAETDSEAAQLADRLPLDPSTRDLRNQLPPDVPGTIRQLRLRVPNGSRVNLTSHRPSSAEILNALTH